MGRTRKQRTLFSPTIDEAVQQVVEVEKGFPRHIPIIGPAEPKAHTPIYKLHKYWARRPHSVFAHMIKNYTRPGEVVLDPFSGGGVTLVEGLQLRRRVVSCDVNPVATFIQTCQVLPADIIEFTDAARAIIAETRPATDASPHL